MPCVSVILPTRDRPSLLGRSLASVLAQTGVELEVVVVDNNRLTPLAADRPDVQALLADPRVRVVAARGAGNAGAARNAGLRAARGEWVTFLDDDDEYGPGKLSGQWRRAEATGAPLVLCGYEVRLGARRRRIQTVATEFAGDELLLGAVWGTPFMFHRRDPGHYFDESLHAAEDLDYAQRYLARHGITRVPNVAAPLVVVHPQPGPRTNTRHEEHWRATRAVWQGQRRRYSRTAGRRFLLRAMLQRHKGAEGSWARLLAVGWRLLVVAGPAEIRPVLNAWLHRSGWFRRWLVS